MSGEPKRTHPPDRARLGTLALTDHSACRGEWSPLRCNDHGRFTSGASCPSRGKGVGRVGDGRDRVEGRSQRGDVSSRSSAEQVGTTAPRELHGRLRHRRIAARRRWRSCACCFLRRDQWRLELSVDEIRIGPGAHRITGLRDQSIQKRAGACKRTAAATSKRRQRAPWLPVAPLRCAYK